MRTSFKLMSIGSAAVLASIWLLVPAASADNGTTPVFTVVLRSSGATAQVLGGTGGSSNGPSTITCSGAYRNDALYDDPHVSSSSNGRAINAHLAVQCTAPVANIQLTSEMCVSNGSDCGEQDQADVSGKAYAMTGADLTCGPTAQTFEAYGSIIITPPLGYTPATTYWSANSNAKAFKTANPTSVECVAA